MYCCFSADLLQKREDSGGRRVKDTQILQASIVTLTFHSPKCSLLRTSITLLDWIILVELQAHAVHTMPLVRRGRVSLSLENVSQMTSAVRAHDLRPLHTECAISVSCHSPRNVVEICRPAAARLEFVIGFVKRRVAAGAGVDTI